MANPTTNYSWVLPTPTDLVTDLPADFDVALQGVDNTVKALNPETTLGDISYRSSTANTNTRLGIGTTGQVLTVSGGVPTWGAVSGGANGWTLLNTGGTSLSGAATITVSSISAKEILILVSGADADASSFVTIRLNGDSSANYTNFGIENKLAGSYGADNLTKIQSYSNNTGIQLAKMSSDGGSTVAGATFVDLCDKTGWKRHISTGGVDSFGGFNGHQYIVQGFYEASAAITSVSIVSSSGNFTAGTVYVMGAN